MIIWITIFIFPSFSLHVISMIHMYTEKLFIVKSSITVFIITIESQ